MKIDRVKGITGEDEGFRWRAVSVCLNALLIMRISAFLQRLFDRPEV